MPTRRRVELSAVRCFAAAVAAVAAETARPVTTSANVAKKEMRLDTQRLPLGRLQHAPQSVLEGDLRLPPQQLPGSRDVRLSHLRVIDRKGLENDLARGTGDPDHLLRELEQRVFGRVSDVHGEVLAARRKQDEPANQVVDVAEAPRLGSVAEDRQRLVPERL